MIEKTVKRYSLIDAGSLCRLFRSGEVFYSSGDDFSDISKLAAFIENNLRSPVVHIMGIDPRYEAFVFIPLHTTSCYIGHFTVKDGHRGKSAARHVVECTKILFQTTPCRSIIGFIRSENKQARMFASYVGMKRIGETKGTLKFGGRYVDETIYQCTAGDFNLKYGKDLGFVKED